MKIKNLKKVIPSQIKTKYVNTSKSIKDLPRRTQQGIQTGGKTITNYVKILLTK